MLGLRIVLNCRVKPRKLADGKPFYTVRLRFPPNIVGGPRQSSASGKVLHSQSSAVPKVPYARIAPG